MEAWLSSGGRMAPSSQQGQCDFPARVGHWVSNLPACPVILVPKGQDSLGAQGRPGATSCRASCVSGPRQLRAGDGLPRGPAPPSFLRDRRRGGSLVAA